MARHVEEECFHCHRSRPYKLMVPGESVYWAEGNYIADSLREINHILRDPRNNEVREIDTRLLDLVFAIRQEIDADQPFHVISGYPSADTNAYLRSHSGGGAERRHPDRPKIRFLNTNWRSRCGAQTRLLENPWRSE